MSQNVRRQQHATDSYPNIPLIPSPSCVRLPYVRADACLGRQGDRLCIDATRRGRTPPRRLPGGSCSERPTRTFTPWIPWRSEPQRDPQASNRPDSAGAPTLYVSQSIFMPLNRFFMCLDRLERSSTETCGPGYAFSIGLDTLNTCNRILPTNPTSPQKGALIVHALQGVSRQCFRGAAQPSPLP